MTGIPGKNPEEVKQWKAERGSQKSALLPTPTPRRNQTTSNRGRSRQSYNNRQNNNFLTRNISQPTLIDNKQNLGNQNETIPTVEDWRILNLLEADISGRWNLYTRTHGVEPSLKMTKVISISSQFASILVLNNSNFYASRPVEAVMFLFCEITHFLLLPFSMHLFIGAIQK